MKRTGSIASRVGPAVTRKVTGDLEQHLFRALDDFVDVPEAAEALVPACEETLLRTDELDAARLQQCDIRLCGRVFPHLAVHRGGDENRGERGERDLREGIVREAVRERRDGIGGGWRDEDCAKESGA